MSNTTKDEIVFTTLSLEQANLFRNSLRKKHPDIWIFVMLNNDAKYDVSVATRSGGRLETDRIISIMDSNGELLGKDTAN